MNKCDKGIRTSINSLSYKRRKTLKFGRFEVSLTVANIFFAFLAILGQVGQNVTLPLWIDSNVVPASGGDIIYKNATGSLFVAGYSANHSNTTGNGGSGYQPRVDSFFVYSFTCISFVVIFGTALIFIRIFQPHRLGETERRFPHWNMFLVGFFDAFNGVLLMFASSGFRTAPYLQAILGNFLIPLTILFR